MPKRKQRKKRSQNQKNMIFAELRKNPIFMRYYLESFIEKESVIRLGTKVQTSYPEKYTIKFAFTKPVIYKNNYKFQILEFFFPPNQSFLHGATYPALTINPEDYSNKTSLYSYEENPLLKELAFTMANDAFSNYQSEHPLSTTPAKFHVKELTLLSRNMHHLIEYSEDQFNRGKFNEYLKDFSTEELKNIFPNIIIKENIENSTNYSNAIQNFSNFPMLSENFLPKLNTTQLSSENAFISSAAIAGALLVSMGIMTAVFISLYKKYFQANSGKSNTSRPSPKKLTINGETSSLLNLNRKNDESNAVNIAITREANQIQDNSEEENFYNLFCKKIEDLLKGIKGSDIEVKNIREIINNTKSSGLTYNEAESYVIEIKKIAARKLESTGFVDSFPTFFSITRSSREIFNKIKGGCEEFLSQHQRKDSLKNCASYP